MNVQGGDEVVRTMKPWGDTEEISMNRKVLETLITAECNKGPVYMFAVGEKFTLYIKNAVRTKLTRTDLKQISRLACKLNFNVNIDIHQPMDIHAIEPNKLIKDEKVSLQKLRMVI